MSDNIIKIGKSVIQHGKENNRIYLMKIYKNDIPEIIPKLDELAKTHKYTKIFVKIPSYAKESFINNNYEVEARIPKLYNGLEDAVFMAKYLSENRKVKQEKQKIKDVLETSLNKNPINHPLSLDKKYHYRKATLKDCNKISKIYEQVFETYPFPIYDPSYIRQTMKENVDYFSIWHKDKLVAVASCEMDLKGYNVEMTDFAVLPKYRGNKFALYLLNKMEQSMKRKGIKTAYTIARAVSYGMNSTFSKLEYTFSGTLIKNTNISGSLETMNVWYKPLFDNINYSNVSNII